MAAGVSMMATRRVRPPAKGRCGPAIAAVEDRSHEVPVELFKHLDKNRQNVKRGE
jgi:hypothetical protein